MKSRMAWAVLKAESGNHTCPACATTFSMLAGEAGSAGLTAVVVRNSGTITPTGMPPSLALPTTTLLAHPDRDSCQESKSNMPLTQLEGVLDEEEEEEEEEEVVFVAVAAAGK